MKRVWIVLAVIALVTAGLWLWHAQPQPTPRRQPVVPAPPPTPSPEVVPAPPPPAPHPSVSLPPPQDVTLAMADGNPLRARWYAATQPSPIIVIDAGAGRFPRMWLAPIQALLAQRSAHVLWLDDIQPRHADDAARRLRAEARWRAALNWLDQNHPKERLALVGVHDAADALWLVANAPRPLSLAVLAPERQPREALPPEVGNRLTYLVLRPAFDPTPTWLNQLHNVTVHTLSGGVAVESDPQVRTDLPGWLFSALGPR